MSTLFAIDWLDSSLDELKEGLPDFIDHADENNKDYVYHEITFLTDEDQWCLTLYVREREQNEKQDSDS